MSLPDTRATSGGGDRIAWLHDTLGVSPEALARWILHMYASDRIPDDFFTSKPSTFPQELLFGDDVLTVIGAMMMLPMAPENKTRLRANRESYCKQLSSMPPVRKFPGGFWTRCTIEHFLRGCDAITTTLKIKDTVHRSSIKVVGAVDSARFVAPSAVDTTVPMRIADKIGQEYCPCALIVYGESGSGKTTAMLLAAVAMDWLWQRPTPFVLEPKYATRPFQGN